LRGISANGLNKLPTQNHEGTKLHEKILTDPYCLGGLVAIIFRIKPSGNKQINQ